MKIQLSTRSVPLVILIVLILAFGVLIPTLGFYWDDWLHIYFFESRQLSELWEFSSVNRPLSTWLYYLTVPLLGSTPIKWHIFALVIRWLTAWSMWAVVNKIWPHRLRETTWMAVLFAVYPIFIQQAISVTYSQQFFSFLLFFVSLFLMIQALENKERFWLYTAFSVVTQMLQMSLVEYFVALELTRPFIIWLFCVKEETAWKRRTIRTARAWAPYFFVLILYVIWRLFLVEFPVNDPNSIRVFAAIQANGFSGLVEYIQAFLRDLFFVLANVWSEVFPPEIIDFQSTSNLLAWALAGITILGVWFIMRSHAEQPEESDESGWVKQAAQLGLLATVLGLVPGWIIGIDPLFGMYSDRVLIPVMFGASVFVVAAVFGLISNQRARTILLALLVGLSVGFHFRITNDYRWDWVRQQRAYWQMYWRAPGLQENASLAIDSSLTTYANRYASGMAVNLLYGQAERRGGVFLFDYYRDGIYLKLGPLASGETITYTMRKQSFTFDLSTSVMILNPIEGKECLWFLSPRDWHYALVPFEVRQALPYVDLDQILAQPTSEGYPPASIFGEEPDHSWCYYFQKADLARQYADWQQVLDLESAAREAGMRTEFGYEMLPFLEAYLALGDWESAQSYLTRIGKLEGMDIRGPVCVMWSDYLPEDQGGAAFLAAQEELEARFACSTPGE